jgi:uncharacterized damage-inducible protein DinB
MTTLQLNENEYAPYYKNYIKALGVVNLFDILESSKNNLLETLKNLPEEKLVYQYEAEKWTIKEILQHIIDTERIMCYRALRFSRNDVTNLPGFDENWYVANSNSNERNFEDILIEFKHTRNATISLFKSFSEEMFPLLGSANESDMSVRALGFIIAGHQIHHINVIIEKYL